MNIASFPINVTVAGDGVSTSVVVGLGYTPTSAALVTAYDANYNNVSANVLSVVPGTLNVTINFVAAFSGNVQILLALANSSFSAAQLQPVSISAMPTTPVTGTFWQATQPVSGTISVNALPTGTNQIGHVIADTGSTTAVTQATPANLQATVTSAGGIFEVSPTTAANTNANPFFNSITDGTTKATVIAATAALKTDLSSVAGTATVTAAAGVQKVGITGNANATLDAAINGAASTNALWTMNAPSTASAAAMATPTTLAALSVANVKASAGNLYGLSVNNTSSTPIYIQFYNTAGTPTLGTSVIFSVPCVIGVTTLVMAPPALANFTTGIGIGASTSPLSTGTPSVAPVATIFFK
jgi:hypothetical protein